MDIETLGAAKGRWTCPIQQDTFTITHIEILTNWPKQALELKEAKKDEQQGQTRDRQARAGRSQREAPPTVDNGHTSHTLSSKSILKKC